MKEAYYFSHDSNASQDEKILNLRADHGWNGYGLYWAVIERLRDSTDFKYRIDSLKGLAIAFGTQLMIIQQIVTSYGLFENDGEYFWSESLTRRMKMAEEKRESFRQKGMKSGAMRSGKKSIDDLDIIEPSSNPTRTELEPSSNPTRTELEPSSNPTRTELEPNSTNEILKGNIEKKGKEITTTTTTARRKIFEFFEKNTPPGFDPDYEANNFINKNEIKGWEGAGGPENWLLLAEQYILQMPNHVKKQIKNNGRTGEISNNIYGTGRAPRNSAAVIAEADEIIERAFSKR